MHDGAEGQPKPNCKPRSIPPEYEPILDNGTIDDLAACLPKDASKRQWI